MRKITIKEYIDLIEQSSHLGLGYASCWLYTAARNNQPTALLIGKDIYLFNPNEVGGPIWNELAKKHVEEYMDYLEEDDYVTV